MYGFRLKYDQWLRRSPLLTKGVTSAILFGLGDRIAQRFENSETAKSDQHKVDDHFDLQRMARMMVWGGLFFAPIGHAWYNYLEKVVPGKGIAAVAGKVAADQLIFSPPLAIAFFTYAGVSENKLLHNSVENAVDKLVPTLVANWSVWPMVHMCTFGFVPLQYRILFINIVNIGWSAFLSRMASKDEGHQKLKRLLDQQTEGAEETMAV
ncbi:Peroxisomal membrane protein MPV17 and related proteins [Plasmopara halstedii]|uniref:Peroxisomal membrane protein MPV17 and related proteins n=1 Tax=Plasmopara halstedii TaxID=4781 RepID=A0A0P1B1Z5_PLAHL|nr:Peroxisomal membrane protein MPV17 and related proteins [Plasmopara halstedii]CEG47802.1 Peroxisomal membrane protein MPV17 and related proteins [Plasmopara halstedii]|eukprot:XP_024584171.1 Peroxisomal membrane protein MPV17 and related proteins [Plasmopara halstedii]